MVKNEVLPNTRGRRYGTSNHSRRMIHRSLCGLDEAIQELAAQNGRIWRNRGGGVSLSRGQRGGCWGLAHGYLSMPGDGACRAPI